MTVRIAPRSTSATPSSWPTSTSTSGRRRTPTSCPRRCSPTGARAAAERVASWSGIIAAGSSDNLLAWSLDGRLLGFSSTGGGRDPDDGLPPLELMGLYVRASSYGTGVGHALLEAAIGDSPAYLWVLDGNVRAIGFYERHGFAFDGATKPEDVGLERRMVRG